MQILSTCIMDGQYQKMSSRFILLYNTKCTIHYMNKVVVLCIQLFTESPEIEMKTWQNYVHTGCSLNEIQYYGSSWSI